MEKVFTINNPSGIHARPASLLVKKASFFPCEATMVRNGKTVNAKSVIGVMSLALRKGETVTVITNGEQAEEALKEIGQILISVFE